MVAVRPMIMLYRSMRALREMVDLSRGPPRAVVVCPTRRPFGRPPLERVGSKEESREGWSITASPGKVAVGDDPQRTFSRQAQAFTHATARRTAQPPKAAFVTRLDQIARQLPGAADNSPWMDTPPGWILPPL